MLIKPDVIYSGIPFERVSLKGVRTGKFINYVGLRKGADFPFPVGVKVEENRRFWRDVQQLCFAFKEYDEEGKTDSWLKIQEFCSWYGYLLPPDLKLPQIPTAEPWEECKRWLNVFHVLTTMVAHAKNGRIPPLQERIDKARTQHDIGENIKKIPLVDGFKYRGNYITVELSPWEEVQIGKPKDVKIRLWPKDDKELMFIIWKSVLNATLKILQIIPLQAVGREAVSITEKPRPLITWAFRPKGAIQAAFIQWYLQEIAPFNMNTCATNDCSMSVIPPRKKFCSERCRQKTKKREQRSK